MKTASLGAPLEEELSAVAAIFERGVDVDVAALSVRVLGPSAGVVFSLPDAYPRVPPAIDIEGLPRTASTALRAQLTSLAGTLTGGPMLFQLIALARDVLGLSDAAALVDALDPEAAAGAMGAVRAASPRPAGIAVFHGALVTERRSVFQAHVARVTSAAEVATALAAILSSSPRMARATHHMRAYRFVSTSGAVSADNDDDGEDAAGGRLAALLEAMGACNVLVVCSRWFGGVLLGPSRFAIIANTAREALAAAGFENRHK